MWTASRLSASSPGPKLYMTAVIAAAPLSSWLLEADQIDAHTITCLNQALRSMSFAVKLACIHDILRNNNCMKWNRGVHRACYMMIWGWQKRVVTA